jgi:predicted nucleic-acid-binding Zn-ribbon protein
MAENQYECGDCGETTTDPDVVWTVAGNDGACHIYRVAVVTCDHCGFTEEFPQP